MLMHMWEAWWMTLACCDVGMVCSAGSEAGQVLKPKGIALDKDGNLVVVDAGNHRIQVARMADVHLHGGSLLLQPMA